MIVSLNVFVTVELLRVVAKFSAFIVIVDVPGVVGVPVMQPVDWLKLKPAGSPVTVRVIGAVPVAVIA